MLVAERVQQVQMSEQEKFLSAVGRKLIDLLQQERNPRLALQAQAERMEDASLLQSLPSPSLSVRAAVYQMFEGNLDLSETWQEVQSTGYWEAAETAGELVTSFLP